MAREGAKLNSNIAAPVLEQYTGGTGTVTSVGTTATAIPATNLSYRKAITIQNLDSTAQLYIRVDMPDVICSPFRYINKDTLLKWGISYAPTVCWFKSAGGTNEYYAATTARATLGITQPQRMYGVTSAGGAESILTSGSVGSLANLRWGWGDGDTLGFNTVYFRLNAEHPNEAMKNYLTILSYPVMPDASSNYGYLLGPRDFWSRSLDGSARVFGYCASTINVYSEELV